MTATPIPKPNPNVVLHEMPDGEHALADTSEGSLLVVNDVGAAVWLMVDGARDVAAIITAVAEAKATGTEVVAGDIEAFLGELRQRGFIT